MRSSRLFAACALALTACHGSPDAPRVAATLSISPASVVVVKGATAQLTAMALDSSGAPIGSTGISWQSGAPGIVTVDRDGRLSAIGYGATYVTAVDGQLSKSVEVLVTAPPTTAAFTVQELSPALPAAPSRFTDSAFVLAGNLIYRNGTGTSIPGCTPIDLNNRSHILCFVGSTETVSSYALWSNGSFTPLAATDTFSATVFEPGIYTGVQTRALNDSDVVIGDFFRPTFSNPACPTGDARCIVLWKNGAATFPGVTIAGSDFRLLVNNRLDFVAECWTCIPNSASSISPFVHLAATGTSRGIIQGVSDVNDRAEMAVGMSFLDRSGSGHTSEAYVWKPDTTVRLGYGAATGINASGVVVGTLDGVGAFVWNGGGVSSLARAPVDAAWTVVNALKVNARGQILAQANNADGRTGVWVILTPVGG